VLWSAFWGIGVVVVGHFVMGASLLFLLFGVALVFLFVMVNGISQGISDSNPISSAFVVTVLMMAALGLHQPIVGLMAAAIVFVSVSVACDMQQDRSTGWRLGTDRTLQFRYQVAGVVMGAIMAVLFAKIFMAAYPQLRLDQTTLDEGDLRTKGWQSAMTFKMVGAIGEITHPKPFTYKALGIGLALGFVIELLRKVLKASTKYKAFVKSGRVGYVTDFVLDSVILSSPYASSFGGFVNLETSLWFGGGGVLGSLINTLGEKAKKPVKEGELAGEALPEDMGAVSLVGGGLIAGDALAALGFGIFALVSKLAGG